MDSKAAKDAKATPTVAATKVTDAPKAAAAPKASAPEAPKAAAPEAKAPPKPKMPVTTRTAEDAAAEVRGSAASSSVVDPKAAATALGYERSSALLPTAVKEALKEGAPKETVRAAAGGTEAAFGTSAAHATGRVSAAPEAKKEEQKQKSANIAEVDPMSPPSAMERLKTFGSTLFVGGQAKAEPPKAKAPAAPAKASGPAAASTTGAKPMSAVPSSPPTRQQQAGDQKGPLAAAAGISPSQAIADVVSSKPQVAEASFGYTASVPRVDGSSTKAMSGYPGKGITPMEPEKSVNKGSGIAALPPGETLKTAGPHGAAQHYAAVAGQVLGQLDYKKQVPREGPATVAVGRAIEAGNMAMMYNGTLPKTTITKKYQVVLVSAELAPYSKTGGLGEAVEGLSVALAALGHRVMIVTPRYDQYEEAWDTDFWSTVTMGGKSEPVHFFHAYKQKVDQVFVDHPCFLACVDGMTGSKLYGPQFGEDFIDNQARFGYFCKAALVAVRQLPLGGFPYGEDVVVIANDWHSGFTPLFMEVERSQSSGNWRPDRTKVISLTHNAVYQGRFKLEEGLAEVLGIPQKFVDRITYNMPIQIGEFNQKESCVNHLGAGILFADRALTVSPTYALEIATIPEKGVELQDLYSAKKCTGIVNGIKESVSPLNEKFLKTASITCGPFTAETVDAAKAEMKALYQSKSYLPASAGPLICFIGRLDVQKGYDLILEALREVLPELEMQIVIIGSGRADLMKKTKALAMEYPAKVSYEGWMGPERYGVVTACDYTIFTSRWEPCGLVQMECMRLGTVPIVAPTGGLRDTVEDGVTGFWCDQVMTDECEIDPDSVSSIANVLRRVCETHASKEKASSMRKAAMAASAQFTWSNAALQYEAVFEEMGAVNVLPFCDETTAGFVTLQDDNTVC
jgi:granule-bound starch synthase